MNIALIGMSGAGKSHIGKRLAERLGLRFLDIDVELEHEYRKALPDIIDDLGEEGFVRAEGEATIRLTWGRDDLLISTGGSIIYSQEAMVHLGRIATVIYLKVPFEVIDTRVSGDEDRQARIIGLKEKGLRALFDERATLYEQYAHETEDVVDFEVTLGRLVEAVDRRAREA